MTKEQVQYLENRWQDAMLNPKVSFDTVGCYYEEWVTAYVALNGRSWEEIEGNYYDD